PTTVRPGRVRRAGTARRVRRWAIVGVTALVLAVAGGVAFAMTSQASPKPSAHPAAPSQAYSPAGGPSDPAQAVAQPPASARIGVDPTPSPSAPAGSPTQPAQPPPPPSPVPTTPAVGSATFNLGTNYGRATGSASWNGTTATSSGSIVDTARYPSSSYLRISYQLLVNGAWQLRYAQPDPYVSVADGTSKTFKFSLNGPIKDVKWNVCSLRTGTTYCTGFQ
ncbi:MAG: hypothetical protein J2P15_05065, partial [Micromonosporaceae bacterium]|nr:hypothetical protein [Micromonosporaceae bacterium]